MTRSTETNADVHQGDLIALPGHAYTMREITGDLIVREGAPQFPALTTVGGHVRASGSAQVTLPVCATVGGDVVAYDSAQVTLPVCATVGGDVVASGSAQVTLPVCATVGGRVWANDYAQVTLPALRSRGDAAALRAALAAVGLTRDDGILCHIVRRRGAVARVRRVGQQTLSYVVTDGTHTAHGATLAEARADLRLKAGDRDTTPYRHWMLTTRVSLPDAIAGYRAITGACRMGVEQWMQGRRLPQTLTVRRILDETRGAYGHDRLTAFIAEHAR